jgi:hypothetical protein
MRRSWDRRSRSVRCKSLCLGAAVAALTTACGTTRVPDAPLAGTVGGCATTVRGVVSAPGSLATSGLPAGFYRVPQGQPAATVPAAVYQLRRAGPAGPRFELDWSNSPGPLNPRIASGGRAQVRWVRVQGHRALLASGAPDPAIIVVYYKPRRSDLISVAGYQVPAAAVLRAARSTVFTRPGLAALPVAPGPVLRRARAVSIALRAAPPAARAATRLESARLSSWTELATLLAGDGRALPVPPALAGEPWRPVWAVLLASAGGSAASPGAGRGGRGYLVVEAAASGTVLLARPVTGPAGWFAALTDRAGHGCPGGSSAAVPFGVLTRAEETFAVSAGARPARSQWQTSTRLVLSTVAAVYRADPSIYGGCFQQRCSIRQLVWITFTTVRALPGKTISCLPGSVSVPPGYHPAQVREYVTISVPGNVEIACGRIPGWLAHIADLAPPG